MQPKQVVCSGVRVLIQALQGAVIHLAQSEDNESATSATEDMDSSLQQDRSEPDLRNLTRRAPELEEGEVIGDSSPENMDQDEVLGRDTYLEG